MITGLYAIGLAYVITDDSIAARDPWRFWWALLAYPIVGPINIANFVLNRALR